MEQKQYFKIKNKYPFEQMNCPKSYKIPSKSNKLYIKTKIKVINNF